mmetsp:Transcript_52789/g.123664  ORF Transcript_52789/g.123664 Transcript_52789/m.123664 type:complete len:242 (-) Transcript_52789:118-843(-)
MKTSHTNVLAILFVASTSCDAATSGVPLRNLRIPSITDSQSVEHRVAMLDSHAGRVLAVHRVSQDSVSANDISKATHDAWKSHHEWSLQEGPVLPRDSPAWAAVLTQMMTHLSNQIMQMKTQVADLRNSTQSQIADLKNDTQSQIADLKDQMACVLLMSAKAINRQAIAPGDPIEFPPVAGTVLEHHELPRTLNEFWCMSAQKARSLCRHFGLSATRQTGEHSKAALANLLCLRLGDFSNV